MKLPLLLSLLFLTSCAIVPWPVTLISTGVDIVLKRNTGKTPLEHGASYVTQTDCNFGRVIDGVFPCMTSKEYVDYLLGMDCDTYTWNNVLQIPKCKKTLDNPS